MTRKIIVSIIAIVLIVGVIGGCFALYFTKGEDKTVSITTEYEQITMNIKNGANTGDQGTISFTGISPEVNPQENHAVKTVDITLTAAPSSLFDGIKGSFKVALAGDLAGYIEGKADLLDGPAGEELTSGSDISLAAFGAGYETALTDTPVYVRLTFSLKAAAIADFSLAAEKEASLTITWAPVTTSVWTYDDNAYYIVGSLSNGLTIENKWDVNSTNQNTKLVAGEAPVIATATVEFQAGDEIKVKKGNSVWIGAYSPAGTDFSNTDEQIHFNNGGTYRVDVKYDSTKNKDYFEVTRVD